MRAVPQFQQGGGVLPILVRAPRLREQAVIFQTGPGRQRGDTAESSLSLPRSRNSAHHWEPPSEVCPAEDLGEGRREPQSQRQRVREVAVSVESSALSPLLKVCSTELWELGWKKRLRATGATPRHCGSQRFWPARD